MADSVTVDGYNPYGPNANADDTRQAQQTNSNDTPTDVNFNAVVARSQALTVDFGGKNYESNGDLRQKYADAKFGKMT
jgi:hypothetical protein